MKETEITNLHCVYCGEKFYIVSKEYYRNDRIIFGIIKCKCCEYPIIFEMLVLIKKPYIKQLIKCIKLRKWHKIEKIILGPFWFKYKLFSIIEKCFGKKVTLSNLLKYRFLNLYSFGYWAIYQRFRYSSTSFLACKILIEKLNYNTKVLELCSGFGLLAFELSRFINQENLFCVDIEAGHLFLLKKLFLNDVNCIVLDLNYGLPFNNEIFSSIVCLDSFDLIDSKRLLIDECLRTSSSNGIILLSHVHNRKCGGLVSGTPLSLGELKNLFHGVKTKIFSERRLIVNYLTKDKVELELEDPDDILDKERVFVIFVVKKPESFNITNSPQYNLQSKTIFNPIYKIINFNNKWILIREIPSKRFIIEFPEIEQIFPERLELEKDVLVHKKYELHRKFILLNVPERF